MFTVLTLCLSIALGCNIVVAGPNSNDLWSIEKPGNIMLYGIFPLRERVASRDSARRLNIEGVVWMGAMVRRISELNRAKFLPGNVTIGYSIRDSSGDPHTGRKQSLSVLNEMINKVGTGLRLPVVIGPATDGVYSRSRKLYELFNVPTISYTTTSARFDNVGRIIRTAPSDRVHVKALVRLLKDMNTAKICIITSKAEPWRSRADSFRMEAVKVKMGINNSIAIDIDTVTDSLPVLVGSQVVVVFAEANITELSTLLQIEKKRHLTWIKVNEFDSPLLRVYDGVGNLSRKIYIRNSRQNHVRRYKKYLTRILEKMKEPVYKEGNWLNAVYEKQCWNESKRKRVGYDTECSKKAFRAKMKSFLGGTESDFQASLTLQGVLDAVNLVVNSVKDTLEECMNRAEGTVSCASSRLPKTADFWFDKLSKTSLNREGEIIRLSEHRALDGNYSIHVLHRLGDRVFRKIREWNVRTDLGDNHNTNMTNGASIRTDNDLITPTQDNHQTSNRVGKINSSTGDNSDNCTQCDADDLTVPDCQSIVAIMNWKDGWAIGLYFLELIAFLAVLLSFVYFYKHNNSPIMILCYSWPDNVLLAVLCLFCFLPLLHIGELSTERCFILWPIVNVVFGFYAALLLTKTLFVQNLLKCEVATDRPGRRVVFSVVITTLQLVILSGFSIFAFPVTTHSTCVLRRVLVLCDIQGNYGVLGSMAFNWILLSLLCVLAVSETLKQRKDFCRTENLIGVATTALVSYTCLIGFAYFDLQLEHYLVITLTQCVIYLANSGVCLFLIYLPTLRLVSTWLRQHIRQQKNLTSIKRAQVLSSKRHSAAPLNDTLFGIHFTPEQTLTSSHQTGYYFDLRQVSQATDMSYPNSLIPSAHEPTHVIFGYGRTTSLNEGASFPSATSVDHLETLNRVQSHDSVYDNVSRAETEEIGSEMSPEELLHEITTYWHGAESGDVFVNEQCRDDVEIAVDETNKWPSLEHLRASDI